VYALLRKIARCARVDAGFGMIELLCAMCVMTVGIMATFAMFHGGAVQVARAAKVTTAAAIGDSEMENLRAIMYTGIGLDATDVAATDTTYKSATASFGAYKAVSDPTNQDNSMVVIPKCPGTPCTDLVPSKTVTGADGKSYRVDTYITWQTTSTAGSVPGRNVKLVTIVVRGATTLNVYARIASSFDESTGE
jgi:Tfp pilus assembly protein PilV